MVTHEQSGRGRRRLPRLSAGLTVRRRLAGAALAAVVLLPADHGGARPAAATRLNLTSDVLVFLLAVVGVALVGGLWPALAAAVAGSLLLNYFFVAADRHGSPSPSGTTRSRCWSSSRSPPW